MEKKEKIINILIIISYLVIAVGFLGSIGIWLPLLVDDYNLNKLTEETKKAIPSNILTYSLSIFLVAVIDRLLHLFFKTSKYSSNILEFFIIVFVTIGTFSIVYFSLKYNKIAQAGKSIQFVFLDKAINFALCVSIVAWISWLYVKLQSSKSNNFSPIGGII